MTRALLSIALVLGFALVSSSAAPRLECANETVERTLGAIVHRRVVQVVTDGLPTTIEATRRAKLAKATWTSVQDPRLIEWEQREGRLKCVATVRLDARVDDRGGYVTAQRQLAYRVVEGGTDALLVEVAYGDLMRLFTMPAAAEAL